MLFKLCLSQLPILIPVTFLPVIIASRNCPYIVTLRFKCALQCFPFFSFFSFFFFCKCTLPQGWRRAQKYYNIHTYISSGIQTSITIMIQWSRIRAIIMQYSNNNNNNNNTNNGQSKNYIYVFIFLFPKKQKQKQKKNKNKYIYLYIYILYLYIMEVLQSFLFSFFFFWLNR